MNKLYRVKHSEDFQTIIGNKKSVVSKQFVIYYKNNDLDHYRVGISVSKKLGKAVQRNKIKRQVRSIIHENFDKNQKLDYIVIVRNRYLYKTFDENKQDLMKLQKRILSKRILSNR